MGYVEENTLPDEEIIVQAEHQAAAFLFPAALIAGGIIAGGQIGEFLLGVLLLYGLYKVVSIAISFLTDEMALTDERAVGQSGIISRDSLDVRNDSISGVSVDQSIVGRTLGYGTVEIIGKGTDDPIGFDYLKDPQEMRNTIQGYLSETED